MSANDTGRTADSRLCILLACFADASGASKARAALSRAIVGDGDSLLDEVILRVNAQGKASVHDPRRAWAGFFTAALTWGVFGLVTSGWSGLGLWGVVGALCGGVFGYTSEHLLTKDELARIGASLPAGSSALTAYVQSADPQRLLADASGLTSACASVVVVGEDLAPTVLGGGASTPGRSGEQLAMVLVRFPGEHTARSTLLPKKAAKAGETFEPEVELLFETSPQGERRVIDPRKGGRVTSRGDTVSWGLFGLVWGAVAGFLSHGVTGSVRDALLSAIGYAVFGMVAGFLYGLWAGRATSARRVRRLSSAMPSDSSGVIAWTDRPVTPEGVQAWAMGSSAQAIVRFVPTERGAVLEA